MEADNMDITGSGGVGSGSRWNPTKEQIDMLEGLYRQGLRTPSADQIQQITNRLRGFGHIEGKNVFYWFQNHKARQRQKQKQENINYYSRLLHKTSVFPPCPNVVCSPFYIPYPDHSALYQQHPKVILPRPLKRKSVASAPATFINGPPNQELNIRNLDDEGFMNYNNLNHEEHQTLDLFPLKPSGNLQSRSGKSSFENDAVATTTTTCLTSSSSDNATKSVSDQRLFDFFRQNGH